MKLACVSFTKNLEKGLPTGSGIFCVVSAETGAPLGVFQENRFMTDLRTGAAGAVSMKHCSAAHHDDVGFIGCGLIARNMARAAAAIRPFKGFAYAMDGAQEFCDDMSKEVSVCGSRSDKLLRRIWNVSMGNSQSRLASLANVGKFPNSLPSS